MIKLKELIKEHAWKRKFGEPLPTLETSTEKHKVKKVNEGGMGILTSDQADVLQGIVLRNKNKNLKGILNVALKSGYFKGVDKKELLGYIDGAKQFVKYMKSHPMESVNEDRGINPKKVQIIEYATYVIDDGFGTLLRGMNNISNAQMTIIPKVMRELQKQQKEFKKIQKVINNKLVG